MAEALPLAAAIEIHPRIRHRGSSERRAALAALIAELGADRVKAAVGWITTDGSPDARELWRSLALYPDGLTPQRVERAERLAGKVPFAS